MADAGRAMMLYRGLYDSAYTYEKLDVVNYNGSLYISTTDGNLGTEPTDETKWKLFLQRGVAEEIQATDTHGISGEAGSSSFVQLLLDSLASRVGKDGNGNVISETYSTKNEMSVLNPFKFVYYTDSDITERISDIDSVEPYVFGHMENCPISSYWVFVVTYKYGDYTLQVCWGNGEMATRYYDKDGTWTNWKTEVNRSNILNTLTEIAANTSSNNVAGALALKELKNSRFIYTTNVLKSEAITANGSIKTINGTAMCNTLSTAESHPIVPLKKGQVFGWNSYTAGNLQVFGMC